MSDDEQIDELRERVRDAEFRLGELKARVEALERQIQVHDERWEAVVDWMTAAPAKFKELFNDRLL